MLPQIILAAITVFGLAIFVPAIAAGLVSGAPQLGAGAAAGTAIGLIGAGAASGALASGAARTAGQIWKNQVLLLVHPWQGRTSAGFQTGGMSGVGQATLGGPIKNAASSVTAPIGDAFRSGQASGFKATGGSGSPRGQGAGASSFPSANDQPAWAKQMHRRQRVREAGMIAAHTLRDGDRGGTGEGPKLDPDK